RYLSVVGLGCAPCRAGACRLSGSFRECGAAFLLSAFEWSLSSGLALAEVVGTHWHGLRCHGWSLVSGRGGHDGVDIENHDVSCIVACCLDWYWHGDLFCDSGGTRGAA